MAKRPIDGVIFDLDGTLTAPGLIDFAAIRRDIGCPDGLDILSHIANLEEASPTQAKHAWGVVEHHEVLSLNKVVEATGATSTLTELTAQGIPVAVLTRNSSRALTTTLKRLGMARFVKMGLARDDAPPKPAPDGILKLTAALGLDARRCLMVGDFVHDVEAGHRAGSWTAWIRTKADKSVPEHTDFELQRIDQVLAVVNGEPEAWRPPVKISAR